jgi:acyl dehydratase
MREVVQRGLYYDELETGVVYRHRPGRTLTEADDVLFSTLTMNHQALHLDAAWAATQPFGQRLVNSMMTLSTLVGLSVGQVTQGTIVANLGFREVEFPKPLFHGDTLYAETEVVEKRLSASRPGQGVVTLEHRGLNQDGVLVARAVRTALFWTSAAHEAASTAESATAPDGARSPGQSAQPGSAVTEAAEPGDIPGLGAGRDDRPGFGERAAGAHEPVLERGDEESAW